MHVLEHGLYLGEPELAWRAVAETGRSTHHFAAERIVLEVEEARCTLEVGARRRVYGEQPFELRPTGKPSAEHLEEWLIVPLEYPKQGDDVRRDVVDDLGLRSPAPAEEDPAHADEGLRVKIIVDRVDHPDDAAAEIALAAI